MSFLILTYVLYTISCNRACDNKRVRSNLGIRGKQVRTRRAPARVGKKPWALHKLHQHENQIQHVPHNHHDNRKPLFRPNRHGHRPALQNYSGKEKYLLCKLSKT
jgi:hypothetical protein